VGRSAIQFSCMTVIMGFSFLYLYPWRLRTECQGIGQVKLLSVSAYIGDWGNFFLAEIRESSVSDKICRKVSIIRQGWSGGEGFPPSLLITVTCIAFRRKY
jgi:hypothetical protein